MKKDRPDLIEFSLVLILVLIVIFATLAIIKGDFQPTPPPEGWVKICETNYKTSVGIDLNGDVKIEGKWVTDCDWYPPTPTPCPSSFDFCNPAPPSQR